MNEHLTVFIMVRRGSGTIREVARPPDSNYASAAEAVKETDHAIVVFISQVCWTASVPNS